MEQLSDKTKARQEALLEYLQALEGGIGLAFSGGVDSVYLLKMAILANANVLPFFMVSQFVPGNERKWMDILGRFLNITPTKVVWDPFNEQKIIKNSPTRCYYCKLAMYKKLKAVCLEKGIRHLIDGTQWDDLNSGDRPGLTAVKELGIKIPLADLGFTKKEIRQQSRVLMLPTWDRPSQSCLATRVYHGRPVTSKLLTLIEAAENFLQDMGINPIRVKIKKNGVELRCAQKDNRLIEKRWEEIEGWMDSIGFQGVILGDVKLEAIF